MGAGHVGVLERRLPVAPGTGNRLVAEAVPIDLWRLASQPPGASGGDSALLARTRERHESPACPYLPADGLPLRLRTLVAYLGLRIPQRLRQLLAAPHLHRSVPAVRSVGGLPRVRGCRAYAGASLGRVSGSRTCARRHAPRAPR